MFKESETVISHSVRLQYLAVIIANLISLCHGMAIGWLSPNLPKLQSDDSPLQTKMTLSEISWIGSCFSIGAILGNCVFGIVSNFIGRKNTLCILALPNLLFWLLVLFGSNAVDLYIGRIFAGATGGGMYICLPLFVAEVADQRIRGRLGSLLMLSVTIGILFGFIAGTYLTYYLVPKIFLPLPIVFFVLFIFFPETPQYFIQRKSFEKAKFSLNFYRDCCCKERNRCTQIDSEFAEILQSVHERLDQNEKYRKNALKNIFKWDSIKAILIGFSLTGINLFSGTFAFVNYTASIFKESGSTLDPHVSSIIVAAIQIFGVYGSTLLVDRIGRKTLLIFSTSGAFVGLISLGIHSYLIENGYDLTACNWIPLISFSTFIFISCFGILPLPFIVLTEILPAEVRTFGSTLCMLSNSVFAFISLKTFPILMHSVHLYGVSWICAGVCFYGILFSIFILKETKGKNLNEIVPKQPTTSA
ncbi:facilitated trehalose transporter Tret1-like isoform X2 [Sitodiplosis mosellana]|uniref:facilitated trehalose transporter Tret1-like isoform X2 n=1 Tax=Sitodiplosis mosellana TaxID=263140 RepID=UPI0024437721|nr:facilitated trehalose transporter Tret1-like isoform X2 [Sitodiplosis mosellana]